MERHPDESARPEQSDDEGFAEGQKQGPDDDIVGDFAEGQEEERHEERGDFAEGQEDPSEEHEHEGDFAEGQREDPGT